MDTEEIKFYKKFNIETEIVGCTELELRDGCIGDCIDCTHYNEDECLPEINTEKLLKLLCCYNKNAYLVSRFTPTDIDRVKEILLGLMTDESNIKDWNKYYKEVKEII